MPTPACVVASPRHLRLTYPPLKPPPAHTTPSGSDYTTPAQCNLYRFSQHPCNHPPCILYRFPNHLCTTTPNASAMLLYPATPPMIK